MTRLLFSSIDYVGVTKDAATGAAAITVSDAGKQPFTHFRGQRSFNCVS